MSQSVCSLRDGWVAEEGDGDKEWCQWWSSSGKSGLRNAKEPVRMLVLVSEETEKEEAEALRNRLRNSRHLYFRKSTHSHTYIHTSNNIAEGLQKAGKVQNATMARRVGLNK